MARIQLASNSDGWVVDQFGRPIAGASAYVYAHGTTTPLSVFPSETSMVALTQPLATNAAGQLPGWCDGPAKADIVYSHNGVSLPAQTAEFVPEESVTGGGGSGVSSFNTRAGAVVLSKTDVTGTGLAASDVGADVSGAAAAEQSRATAAEALAAQKSANLSDLASASTARTNLGLGSAATQASSAFDAAGAATAAVGTEQTRATAAEALLAPKASPSLTGSPTAPTQAALDASTKLSTTAYADAAVGVETTRATAAEALKASSASVTAEASRATAAEALAAQKSANLSDLASAGTARTNLGLGTAATQASSAFDAAGAATTEQTRALAAEALLAQGFVPTAVKTSAYTAAPGDYVPVDVSGGAVAIALPTAPADRSRIGIKIVAQTATPSNAVTVTAGGVDVFNKAGGSTSVTLPLALFSGVLLQYKSSSGVWYVQSTDVPLGTASGAAKLGTDGTVGGPGGSPVSAAGVSSFNTRTGAVTLSKADVTSTGLAAADVSALGATAAAGGKLSGAYPNPGLNAASTDLSDTAALARLASPSFTGSPTAPTAAALDSSTKLGTTAYADAAVAVEATARSSADALKAPLASPALTGNPTVPTQTALDNSTRAASTAYADAAVAVEKTRALAAEAATKAISRVSAATSAIHPTAAYGTGTNAGHESRQRFRSAVAVHGLELTYYLNYGVAEASTPAGVDRVFNAAVEYPSGTFYECFSADGKQKPSITPNGIGKLFCSGVEIPANTDFWVRSHTFGATTDAVVAAATANGTSEYGLQFVADQDHTLTASGQPAFNSSPMFGPQAVTGIPYVRAASVAGLFDSIGMGKGDPDTNGATNSGTAGGWFGRAISTDGSGRMSPALPAVQIGISSETALAFATGTKRTHRIAILDAVSPTYVVVGLGTNDTGNLSALESNIVLVWQLAAARGSVFATTLIPTTTSTDSWATTANQTVGINEASRLSFNAWIRAGGPIDPTAKTPVAVGTSGALVAGNTGHPLCSISHPNGGPGYIELADAVESARNSGFWKVDGTAFKYTADGVHPTTAGHVLMAANFNKALLV